MPAVALSYDRPSTPLHEVTFCVVDLETTGASASSCAITEVGAAKFRGGTCLGTFQTLVDAGVPMTPVAARITGITDAMLADAPPLPGVLAALNEFVGGAVLVGHNLRFDVSFLDAALAAGGRATVRLLMVDTVALARGLLGDEVPDCRLATLAEHLGLDHRPTHRALDDVLATVDLLHVLLERAAGLGVATLDDLLAFPRLAGHPQAAKLALTTGLPRGRGVYLFRDARGRPLYLGRAGDVRRRVRSFFGRRRDDGGSEGRVVRQLLRTVHRIEHVTTRSALESAVAVVRLGHTLVPRHNRRAGRWRLFRYVRLPDRPSRRPAVVPTAATGGATHLGPFPSAAAARAVADAAMALDAPGMPSPAVADLAGAVDDDRLPYGTRVTLAAALRWHHRLESLRRAARVVLSGPDGTVLELRRGLLVVDGSAVPCAAPGTLGAVWAGLVAAHAAGPRAAAGPPSREEADELDVVATWLDRSAGRVRLVHVDGELASTWPRITGPPAPASLSLTPPGARPTSRAPHACLPAARGSPGPVPPRPVRRRPAAGRSPPAGRRRPSPALA